MSLENVALLVAVSGGGSSAFHQKHLLVFRAPL
ncbi:hypothetical protein P4O66_010361 [Electrophorus voltai]|uniref:Uncharacterized protein n=1 Tax=Electrophorus voltai TaxID=2609070 RepID=A0AAD9DWB9_9TELE|nr:hypothetical protein P4O66_010361 [Electrophorus voltai]